MEGREEKEREGRGGERRGGEGGGCNVHMTLHQ